MQDCPSISRPPVSPPPRLNRAPAGPKRRFVRGLIDASGERGRAGGAHAGYAPAAEGAALVFPCSFFPSFFSVGSGGWISGPFCPQPEASAIQGKANARRNILRRPGRPERTLEEDDEDSGAWHIPGV